MADPTQLSSDLAVSTPDLTVTLPKDANDELLIEQSGETIGLGIPGGARAESAVQVSPTAVVYEGVASDTSIVAQATDGGIQALITIDGSAAPTEFNFPVAVPDGGFLADAGDGSIDIVNAMGVTVAYVAPAWAKDASGRTIPTTFEIRGTSLIQHVEHAGAQYPVVADPKLQSDCGWLTCTVRFDRKTTRDARDASLFVVVISGLCVIVSEGLVTFCAVVAAIAGTVAILAQRWYENGNCIGFRYSRNVQFPVIYPTQVNRRTYNCS